MLRPCLAREHVCHGFVVWRGSEPAPIFMGDLAATLIHGKPGRTEHRYSKLTHSRERQNKRYRRLSGWAAPHGGAFAVAKSFFFLPAPDPESPAPAFLA